MASMDVQAISVASPDLEKSSLPSSDNVEKGYSDEDAATLGRLGMDDESPDGTVHRNLKQRHLSMIALGGTIGTGLFV
ncbi:hypothetical protein, partial [Sporisorium scitamineum]